MFFRIILFIILAYIIVGFLKRLLASPVNTNTQHQNANPSKEKEGSVTIKEEGSKKQKINKAEGDYVDFEDV